MSTSTPFSARVPACLAAFVLVASGCAAIAPAGDLARAPRAINARNDKVTVMAGSQAAVKVLSNDKVKGTKIRVRLVKKAAGITVKVEGKTLVVRTTRQTAPQTYAVTYKVTDGAGRSDTARVFITVRSRTITPTPTPIPSPTPSPTLTPTATPTIAGNLVALINALPVAPEVSSGYDRDTWTHWNTGVYSDGCDTRGEVLRVEAVVPVATGTACPYTTDRSGGGQWYSYYDGVTTTDPSSFDVDHMVALAEAHDSGGYAWSMATKEAFANDQGDPRALVAVTASANRGKGDQDPGEWMPLRERCRYIGEWTAVKTRWSLTVDQTEKESLLLLAGQCGDMAIEVIPR